jgi:hypothetical protein
MTLFLCVVCLIIGFILGRIYGWMKYHYPEFQEAVKLKAARLRAERMEEEARAERARGMIDDELDRRALR